MSTPPPLINSTRGARIRVLGQETFRPTVDVPTHTGQPVKGQSMVWKRSEPTCCEADDVVDNDDDDDDNLESIYSKRADSCKIATTQNDVKKKHVHTRNTI